MLIVTSKSPGVGKQKPRQWGPLSAVRSAVFKNSEMIGIDPLALRVFMPLWEMSGAPRNIITGAAGIVAGVFTWEKDQYTNVADVVANIIETDYYPDENVRFQMVRKAAFNHSDNCNNGAHDSANHRLYIGKDGGSTQLYCGFGSGYDSSAGGNISIEQFGVMAAVRRGTTAHVFLDGEATGTTFTSNFSGISSTPYSVGGIGRATNETDQGITDWALVGDQELTDEQVFLLADRPSLLLQQIPQTFFLDMAAGGPTVYDETVDSILISVTSQVDRQNYKDTADTLAQSGASLSAVVALLDSVVSTAISQSSVFDQQQFIDSGSTTASEQSSETDQQQYADQTDTVATEQSGESDVQDYVDTGETIAVESATVSDQMTSSFSETVLSTAISATKVDAAQHYIDILTSLAQSDSSVDELGVIAEQVTTVAQSLSSASEQQQFYKAVATTAVVSSSIEAVQTFLETITDTAAASASVIDILVGQIALSGRVDLTSKIWPRIDLISIINQRIDLRSRLYIH